MTAKDVELDSDVSSLQAVDVDHDSDVSSLAADISSNDVVGLSFGPGDSTVNGTMNADSEFVAVSLGREFASTPVVIAMLRSSNASDPIVPAMVTDIDISTAGGAQCTVSFGDGLPSQNYKLEIFASVAG